MRELSARIRALLRRPANILASQLVVGDLCLHSLKKKVTRSGRTINLLPKEFTLLEYLMRNVGQVISAEVLIKSIWLEDKGVSPDTIRSHIKSLRKKLGETKENSVIHNVYGLGYKLEL